MGHLPAVTQDRAAVEADAGSHAVGRQLRIGVAKAALHVGSVEPEEVVRCLVGGRTEVPTQAVVDGELLGYLPVVLRVRCESN